MLTVTTADPYMVSIWIIKGDIGNSPLRDSRGRLHGVCISIYVFEQLLGMVKCICCSYVMHPEPIMHMYVYMYRCIRTCI